jgi:multiple sugar transport system permease protein
MTNNALGLSAPPRQSPSRAISILIVCVLLGLLLAFFILPVLWLLLAPSKTADQLVHDAPLSFGSLSQIGTAWKHLFSFQNDAMAMCLRNSAAYSGGSLILTLLTSIPAGYALALTRFRGRKTLLAITLVTMIMPSATLVLPIFLELNKFHLIGTAWSIILPFSFYPFGVYLVYIYFGPAFPGTSSRPLALTAARSGRSLRTSPCRWPSPSWGWWRSSVLSGIGTTSSCPTWCCPTVTNFPCR